MPGPLPLKLLEISILSAQDLAPVSKLLRTYAVAWVHPDQKLTTRADHQGHTNPTWNYRFVFRIDDRFLASDSSALTIEIYNVSWLRDIPIGTVRAPISSLLPPPSPPQAKSSAARFLSLPIRRPSGPLQGTLNIGFNLIDESLPLESELSASTTSSDGGDLILNNPTINWGNRNQNQEQHKGEDKKQPPSPLQNAKTLKLNRSLSERTVSDAYSYTRSKSGSVFSGRIWEGLKIGKSAKSTVTSEKGSVYSYYMRPLPSEVAESMAKGLYSGPMDDVGSSVFENWTVGGDNESVYRREEEVANVLVPMPMPVTVEKAMRWETDDGLGKRKKKKKKKKKGSDGGGLLSCFGCGYECNIICGGPKNKMKKNQKRLGEMPYNHSAENLRLLYQ